MLDASTSLSDSRDFGVGDNPEWDNGGYKWVVIKGEVTISRLIVKGEGHLILTDGSRLVCSDGVVLQGDGNSLSIYSQSSGDQEGRLEAKLSQSKYKKNAAIGCIDDYEVNGSPGGMGTLVIHGGVITATGGNYAAGIGGGEDRGIQPNGSVTIYGGTVTATGGDHGAGIGGGYGGGQGGSVTIYGGKVVATGGEYGAGIGGGDHYRGGGEGGVVAIHGGDVTANVGIGKAMGLGADCVAIGRGANGPLAGSFLMTGGKVHANGINFSAIYSPDIRINGGELTARGHHDVIGGAYMEITDGTVDVEATDAGAIAVAPLGTLNITGGNVRAIGGSFGAGITGYNTVQTSNIKQCYINITGGTVYAKGGSEGGAGIGSNAKHYSKTQLTITDGTVTAIGQAGGAGIGGGKYVEMSGGRINETQRGSSVSNGMDVVISGGIVTAQGSANACAIGRGQKIGSSEYDSNGKLQLDGLLSVKSGTGDSDLLPVATASRVDACRGEGKYVRIEACEHADYAYYTYDDIDYHSKHCTYCNHTEQELHTYDKQEAGGVCVCGKKYNEDTDTWGVKFYEATSNKATTYDEGTIYRVVKGQKLILPPHKDIDGLTFMGWLEGTTTDMPDCEMRDDELLTLSEGGMEMTPESDKIYYARYRCQYDAEWTWNGDEKGVKTATVTVKWRNGDETLTDLSADVYNYTVEPTEEAREGKYHYSATAVWQKKDGVQYQFTDQIEIPYVYSVQLKDNASNVDVLANNEGNLVRSLTLQGRTFYHDGYWNTLCLPFDVTIAGSVLDGADVRALDNANLKDGVLTLNFTAEGYVTKLTAGTPYIIKWDGDGTNNLVNPVFTDVTVSTDTNNFESTDGSVQFKGTYNNLIWTTQTPSILLMGANNALFWPDGVEDSTLGACRAYFQLADGQQARQFVLNFDGEGTQNGIGLTEITEITERAGAWYTLDGVRLDGKPTKKGLYIHGGKKVVVP